LQHASQKDTEASLTGILTANGFTVSYLTLDMFIVSSSGSIVAEAMVPSPPALETAAVISQPVIHVIPPSNIEYRIPTIQ